MPRAILALALVGAVFAGFWLLHPMLLPLGRLNLLIFFMPNGEATQTKPVTAS